MVSPDGKLPPEMVHRYGGVPPAAVSCWLYVDVIELSAKEDVVIRRAGETVIVQLTVAPEPAASAARTENVDTPASVGVPATEPDAPVSDNPTGSAPDCTDQLTGGMPPDALRPDE
jgi:hypothetical protein